MMTGASPTRIIHVTLGKEFGGMPEIVRSEIAELERRSIPSSWVSLSWPKDRSAASAALSDWLHEVEPQVDQDPVEVSRVLHDFGRRQAPHVLAISSPGDIVVLHDPVPAALAPYLVGQRVVWRSHIGSKNHGALVGKSAVALNPFLHAAEMAIFHRSEYAWADIPTPVVVCQPGIDLTDIKVRDLPADPQRDRLLLTSGRLSAISESQGGGGLLDGAPSRILDDNGTGFLSEQDTRYILHVSRWDPLKGQEIGLKASLESLAQTGAHYVLLGPELGNTLMGATNRAVLEGLLRVRDAVASDLAERIHVWSLHGAPPSSPVHREAINRIRSRSRVVVSPSIREGFGLGVTEAMYGRKKVLASPIGGHLDQIENGVNGWLAPVDSDNWPRMLSGIERAGSADVSIQQRARESVEEKYSVAKSIDQQLRLFDYA